MSGEYTPPSSREAEMAVLGGALLVNDVLDEIEFLQPGHFYGSGNEDIFAAMRSMHAASTPIDFVTLAEELERRKKLGDVGGPAYINECLETVPNAAHTSHYARQVFDRWQRRQIGYAAMVSLRESRDLNEEPRVIATRCEERLHGILETNASRSGQSVDQIMLSLWDHMESGGIVGQPTGYEAFDDKVSLKPGNFIILAARPSQGKSALAANISVNFAKRGVPVQIVSLEMERLEYAERLLASEANVAINILRSIGEATDSQRSSLVTASGVLSSLPLFVNDPSDATVSDICSLARLAKRQRDIGLLIIDYLQLISPDDRRMPREQQVATISRSLKQLAKSLQIPVLCLAQLNREVEKRKIKRPQLADLRESGSLEQDTDQVWFVWRPNFYVQTGEGADQIEGEVIEGANNPRHAEVIVAKNRGGRVGISALDWDDATTTFRDRSVYAGNNF
ncbi:MAG: replicative DNA helicase [Planctomycetaceae bacterium]|nr:replicative DNA helicase [Planctomycetaceae bacterium]